MLFTGYGGNVVCHILGFFYPLIKTIQTLVTRNKDGTYDNYCLSISLSYSIYYIGVKHWILYWLYFSFIITCEYQLQSICIPYIPLYFPLKFTLLLYLMVKEYSGPLVIYNFCRSFIYKRMSTDNSGKKK